MWREVVRKHLPKLTQELVVVGGTKRSIIPRQTKIRVD